MVELFNILEVALMAERFCGYCKNIGITCERPLLSGEPLARLVRTKDDRQMVTLEPIERCVIRCEVLNKVKEWFK